jgi:hypothetical protein
MAATCVAGERCGWDRHDTEITRLEAPAKRIETDNPEVNDGDRFDLIAMNGGARGNYREGTPLVKGQSFAGFFRAQGEVQKQHEPLNLGQAAARHGDR